MESLIYYPGFEVEDENWLKFSLLYFDELRPIIPDLSLNRQHYLSPKAIRIMNETDLINPYRPDPDESTVSSILACEEFKKYLEHPELYFRMFSKTSKKSIIDIWRSPSQQNSYLYNGKFSYEFYDFCIENGIATSAGEGINISKDLGFVYMSFLADVIAKHRGYEMFTDIKKYDALLLKNDKQLVNDNRASFDTIRKYIELYLPTEIKRIPLEDIIQLRNRRDFNECRRAFVHEMELCWKNKERNLGYSLNDQLEIGKDIKKILTNYFGTLSSVYLLANEVGAIVNDGTTPATVLATIGATILNYQSKNTKQYLNDMKMKIQAKRYLGTLEKRISTIKKQR